MLHHRARNSARVRLSGEEIHLGPWGTAEALANYDAAIAAWIANGRAWPPPGGWSRSGRAATAETTPTTTHRPGTLIDLAERYLTWAEGYYRKGDRPTKTALNARRALQLLLYCGVGEMRPTDFGPTHLKRYQAYLLKHPTREWSRATINEYAAHVVRFFDWAAGEGLAHPDQRAALRAVRPIRKGRKPFEDAPEAREGDLVNPVPAAALEATLAHARPMLAAMIRAQLLSGMRPTEVAHLRGGDLVPTAHAEVVAYHVRPDGNKMDHEGIARVVYLGPQCVAALRPYLTDDPGAYVFSPARARAEFDAGRRAARRTPAYPSHAPEVRAARRGARQRPPAGEKYTTDSYRRAIWRACDAAFPHPTLGETREHDLTPEEKVELAAWRDEHRWNPNQLRHNAATYITEHESLEVAMVVLGHRSIETTLRYAKVHDRRAMLAALRRG